jgi:hypothetical protein
VILQVLADAGTVVRHIDAQRLQTFAIANAGQLQQLRRLHRASREHDTAIGLGDVPTRPRHCATRRRPSRAILDDDALDQRAGHHLEILSASGSA